MPDTKCLDSWEVAAAVLFIEGEMHIERLTERVVESGISTLGLRGDTPRQSLCPQLLKHTEVFRAYGRGYYGLWSGVAQVADPRVEAAKRRYLECKNRREQQ